MDWANSLAVAKRADAMGIDLLVPLARWRGFGGQQNYLGEGFETVSWAAGLAAQTERIMCVATAHTYAIHPIVAAKQAVTIDHLSGGRFALNLTMGWFTAEQEMFGQAQLPHDERYAFGQEWIDVCKRLWSEDQPFDYEGKYFNLHNAEATPLPFRRPFPLLIGAGASPAGRDFAARNLDISFVTIESLETAPGVIDDVRARASAYGRELELATFLHVICRESEDAAWDAYRAIVDTADWDATHHMMGFQISQSQSLPEMIASQAVPEDFERQRELMAVGGGGYVVVGDPDSLTRTFETLSQAGIDTICMTLPDYDGELNRFDEQVMPLLREAGLRA